MVMKICRRNKYGYCKYGDTCNFKHVKEICKDNKCNIFNLRKDIQRFVVGSKSMGDVNLQLIANSNIQISITLMK